MMIVPLPFSPEPTSQLEKNGFLPIEARFVTDIPVVRTTYVEGQSVKSGWFMLDSGATASVMLPTARSKKSWSLPDIIILQNKIVVQLPKRELPRGTSNLATKWFAGNNISGILGKDFFDRARIAIDYEKHVVSVALPSEDGGSMAQASVVRLVNGANFYVDVSTKYRRFSSRAIVDTGCSSAIFPRTLPFGRTGVEKVPVLGIFGLSSGVKGTANFWIGEKPYVGDCPAIFTDTETPLIPPRSLGKSVVFDGPHCVLYVLK